MSDCVRPLLVVYEDKFGDVPKGFGPHELLVGCCADAMGVDPNAFWQFRRRCLGDPRPAQGVNRLFEYCSSPDRLDTSGRGILAVVDGDRLRDHVRVPANADEFAIAAAARARISPRVCLGILRQNIEALVSAAAGTPIVGKSRMKRDLILASLGRDPSRRHDRDRLRAGRPDFDLIVRTACAMLQQPLGTPCPK